jgi:hypothetical protein
MENEFVPYEQALALKELGFDEPCFGYYNYNGTHFFDYKPKTDDKNLTKAPLYQQAFRWFEETYGLFVDRKTMCSVNEMMGMDYYICSINGTWQVEFPADYSEFDFYKANTACLKKLIEIVKK